MPCDRREDEKATLNTSDQTHKQPITEWIKTQPKNQNTHQSHWKQCCQQNRHSKTASLQTEAKPSSKSYSVKSRSQSSGLVPWYTHTHKSISHDKSHLSPQEHSIFFISMKRQREILQLSLSS